MCAAEKPANGIYKKSEKINLYLLGINHVTHL